LIISVKSYSIIPALYQASEIAKESLKFWACSWF